MEDQKKPSESVQPSFFTNGGEVDPGIIRENIIQELEQRFPMPQQRERILGLMGSENLSMEDAIRFLQEEEKADSHPYNPPK